MSESTPTTEPLTEAERDDLLDVLDRQHHDSAYHVHAAECCWPFGGAMPLVTEAIESIIAARVQEAEQRGAVKALREAAAAIRAARDGRIDFTGLDFHPIGAPFEGWLRDRAERIASTSRDVCADCGAEWKPVRRGECIACGSDRGPKSCSCGSPDTYSLTPGETVVHRTDGTCYIASTSRDTEGAG